MRDSEPHLESWVHAFRGPLIGLLVSRGADWRRAEELAQDTFAEAWLSWSRFRGPRDNLAVVGAWLRGIAYRLHGAALRSERRRAARPIDEVELAAPAADSPDQQADPRTDPRLRRLAESIARLPAAQQTVLRMRYFEDSSTRDVAALLGVSAKAVERRLYHARRNLRKHLDRAETATEATR